MNRIEVPTFEPCDKCSGGKVFRNGRTEQCRCFIEWWESVRLSILGSERKAG